MTGKTILVVDDHQEIIELLQDIFGRKGCRVVTASGGQEALAKVYQEHPQLILLDIMMPMFSGYEICRTLKQDPKTQHIPIIFLTAKGNPEDIERGFNMQADGYVVKPFEPSELYEFVAKVMKQTEEPAA
jgi:CheY-like chemotaxis protein